MENEQALENSEPFANHCGKEAKIFSSSEWVKHKVIPAAHIYGFGKVEKSSKTISILEEINKKAMEDVRRSEWQGMMGSLQNQMNYNFLT